MEPWPRIEKVIEPEEVAKAVENAGLTMVQLNGEEGPAFCAEVARRTGVKVVKAVHVTSAADIHGAEAYRTDFHLFDRRSRGLWGGTGERFDWGLLAERRWLFVSLAPGVLSEPGARLLGAVVSYCAWAAVESRSAIPEERRRPVFLYFDELQSLSSLPLVWSGTS